MLATPRSLSQPTTSFIASQCQGIRQTPLLCLISRFVSETTILRSPSSARSVQGTTPTTKTALTYPFLPLRLGDGARKSRLSRPHLPMNDVKERSDAERLVFYAARFRTRVMVEADGIEPTTSCLQSRRSPN